MPRRPPTITSAEAFALPSILAPEPRFRLGTLFLRLFSFMTAPLRLGRRRPFLIDAAAEARLEAAAYVDSFVPDGDRRRTAALESAREGAANILNSMPPLSVSSTSVAYAVPPPATLGDLDQRRSDYAGGPTAWRLRMRGVRATASGAACAAPGSSGAIQGFPLSCCCWSMAPTKYYQSLPKSLRRAVLRQTETTLSDGHLY